MRLWAVMQKAHLTGGRRKDRNRVNVFTKKGVPALARVGTSEAGKGKSVYTPGSPDSILAPRKSMRKKA
jgi:hypothetical protein